MGKLFMSSMFNLLCLYRSINLVDIAQSRRNHENVMAVLAAQDLQDLHIQHRGYPPVTPHQREFACTCQTKSGPWIGQGRHAVKCKLRLS